MKTAVTGPGMEASDKTPAKTFIITFPNQTHKPIKNVYTHKVDKGILYLKDENGETKAAFKKWWAFVIE